MDQVTPQDGADLIRAVIGDAEEVQDPLEALIEATKMDPGAPFTPEALELLAKLKAEDRPTFEAVRAQLKVAGCRVGVLDEALAQLGGDHGSERDPKQADLLLQLSDEADLFHTADDTPYADITVAGHRETWPVRSKGFRGWLTKRFYEETGSAPNGEALRSALDVLEAQARFDGPERPVFVRVGEHEGRLYLDLANATWQAVEIDETGWRVVDTPPVRFRRAAGTQALPRPVRGGTIEALRPFLNVASDADFTLAVAWLLAALRSQGPYPVLALSGEQGSAKSTFSKMLKALVDPNVAALRPLPREEQDLYIAASHGHVLVFDNLSVIAPAVSDTLCRLSTGGGYAKRQLYTDEDEVLFDLMRPLILNGITDVIGRPDLADRAIVLTLESISEERRRPEAEIWAAFEAERPQFLGALLDGVVEGLRRLPATHLPRLPRLADFARWASACETAFWPQGTFWAAYEGNRQEAVESVIEADPVAAAVRAHMAERAEWSGTAADLLAELTQIAGERIAKAKAWPESPRALSGRLRRAATALRKAGIEIVFDKGKGKSPARMIHLSTPISAQTDNERSRPSEPSEPSDPSTKVNGSNGFGAVPDRTVAAASDGRKASPPPTVRRNPLERQEADGSDGSDANRPDFSEPTEKSVTPGWRMRL